LESNLNKIELEKTATVATYKVPSAYGGYAEAHPTLVDKTEIDKPVDLSKAYELSKKHGDRIRIYPGSMEQRGSEIYALKSRTVAVVGIGASIENARQLSLEGIEAIKGGALWNRTDVASEQHIEASKKHMDTLRRRQ
jgi:phosphoribosylamine-glycine ligase